MQLDLFRRALSLTLLAIGAIVPAQQAAAQKVHALVVGDISPAAGWGKYAPNLTMDLTGMFVFFYGSLPESQLEYRNIQIEEDKESDPKLLLTAIKELSPGPNDTVFFYFTGHGAVDDHGHYLALAQGKLYRQTIIDTLQSKKPRLVVVITDCCNSRSDGYSFFAPAPYYETPRTVAPLFRSLLMEPRGVVDINSCSPGESAFFTAMDTEMHELPGSIFTKELTNWVAERLQQKRTWDELVRGVSLKVHTSFASNYPKGAQVAKGQVVQTQQTVYAIGYPGKPEKEGPRTGIVARDFQGQGAVIIEITSGSPATQVYDISSKQFISLQPHQVLVSANGKGISNIADFVKFVGESPQIMRLGIRDAKRGQFECLLRMRY